MLWKKAWLETRWRFLIGLALLICSAAANVFMHPQVVKLLPPLPMPADGELARRVRETVELAREYRGYVWVSWFRENLPQWGTLFAILLGTGGLFAGSFGGGTLFTLSMPVSRNRLHTVRAAVGLAELLVLALASSFLIPLFSRAVQQSYALTDAAVHAFCFFAGASVFLCLASLLSTSFGDPWRPFLITLLVAGVIGSAGQISPELWRVSLFRVMNAEGYFRYGALPWVGLALCVATSGAFLYGGAVNLTRRDF